MTSNTTYTVKVALIVALGGFLMGFDASVISGVVGFIGPEFNLTNIEIGWAVASLTLTSTIAMMSAGPISDRFGRRPVLVAAAIIFTLSAVASALAPDYLTLVIARMIGGFGVGTALIIAPMYIAEISPPAIRGRMVSFNQLNIVLGISVAYFSNYFILSLSQSDMSWAQTLRFDDWTWRWMLGVEAIPAVVYFFALFFVPESPRWLVMKQKDDAALETLVRVSGEVQGNADLKAVKESLRADELAEKGSFKELFMPAMRLVMVIGITIAILQQITGINSVFFYAPMIFEQSGIGTDASFMQAVLVGIINLVFTIVAIALIDKIGRRPLMLTGLVVIAASMMLLAYGFGTGSMSPEGQLVGVNPTLILIGILSFVAGFGISLGPVMWVLFSELFPNRIRGIAISFVGLINSTVSFIVQLVFPWELENFGPSITFLIYGSFAIIGLLMVMKILPETKGRSLEELEAELVPRTQREV
jgi:sugar porter (SP) family MFS transporter